MLANGTENISDEVNETLENAQVIHQPNPLVIDKSLKQYAGHCATKPDLLVMPYPITGYSDRDSITIMNSS